MIASFLFLFGLLSSFAGGAFISEVIIESGTGWFLETGVLEIQVK